MHTTIPTPDDQADRAARAGHERRRLVTHMAAMAEGDQAAVFTLVADLGHHLAGVVCVQLRAYGRRDLLRDRDVVDGLVVTAALEILDRAGSWDPDGAPPWIWARHAIRAAVVREIGHPAADFADRLELADGPDRIDQVDGTDWTDRIDVLDPFDPAGSAQWLGSTDPRVRLLGEALDRVASHRDRHVVQEFLLQKAYGDPSPSHTVADELGLSADNVRQIVSRTRRRLRALLDDDDRYRLLGESGWLAA